MDEVPNVTPTGSYGNHKWQAVVIAIVAIAVLAGIFVFWSPGDTGQYFTKGVEAFTNGDYETAVEYLRKADRANPESMEVRALLARALVAQANTDEEITGDEARALYEESLEHFNAARELGIGESYPEYENFLRGLGLAYRGVNDYDNANKTFLELIEKYPESAFLARVLVARDYVERLNNPEEAREILNPAFASIVTYPELLVDAHTVMMRLSTYFGDYENAAVHANSVVDNAEPDNVSSLQLAYVHLATAFSKRGDLESARSWIQKADELLGETDRHACVLAHMYIDHKQFDLAIASAQKREEPRCWAALAKSYAATGRSSEAKALAQQVLDALHALETKDIFAFQGISEMEEIVQMN